MKRKHSEWTQSLAAGLLAALPLVAAGGVFDLVRDGAPAAEFVIGPALEAEAAISPWRLGAELYYPGGAALGIGRPWVDGEIRQAELHPWSRAGVLAAVEDFNTTLAAATGVELPVVNERSGDRHTVVFAIEPAPRMRDDAFRIDFPDADTLRIAGSGRSVRWALNHLLETHAGVRWLFFGHAHIPALNDLLIPREPVAQTASFPFRRDPGYYRRGMLEHYLPHNVKFPVFPRSGGHGMTQDVFPIEKYAPDQSWPEAIMPVHGGEKVVLPPPHDPPNMHRQVDYLGRWHPCFSSPETVTIAVENMLEILAADPDRDWFELGVMDWGGHCRCDDCVAAVGDRTNDMGHPHYSELYYAWVNAVAEQIAARYPEVHFGTILYRELFDAPDFKLHPNIVPRMSLDVHQLMNAEVRAEKWRQIRRWFDRSQHLGLSEYAWGIDAYALPRIYFGLWADFIKEFQTQGGMAWTFGGWKRAGSESEGPKSYLFYKLSWDVTQDLDAILDDWYRHTVGEAAAPYLRAYFDFWEDYWTGARIRRTPWYRNSIRGQYLRWREWTRNPGTHTFALQRGDMARLREWMEAVVDKAETPGQQTRAARLMLAFEYYEANATALFAEIVPPEAGVPDEASALEIIASVPAAFAAVAHRQTILDPLFDGSPPRGVEEFDPGESLLAVFEWVGHWATRPEVAAAANALFAEPGLTEAQREALRAAWERGSLLAQGRQTAPAAQVARRSTQDLTLDGRLDDPFWADVPVYALVEPQSGEPAPLETRFQMAWAEDGLYVGIFCAEPDADGPVFTTDVDGDRAIFAGETIELLLDTGAGANAYYQIVINPAGAVIDLDRSRGVYYNWSSGARAHAHIGEGYWSLEVRIPVDPTEEFDPDPDVGIIGAPPTDESPWFFNVCRLRIRGDERVGQVFSPTGGGFHVPERFGRLIPAP